MSGGFYEALLMKDPTTVVTKIVHHKISQQGFFYIQTCSLSKFRGPKQCQEAACHASAELPEPEETGIQAWKHVLCVPCSSTC